MSLRLMTWTSMMTTTYSTGAPKRRLRVCPGPKLSSQLPKMTGETRLHTFRPNLKDSAAKKTKRLLRSPSLGPTGLEGLSTPARTITTNWMRCSTVLTAGPNNRLKFKNKCLKAHFKTRVAKTMTMMTAGVCQLMMSGLSFPAVSLEAVQWGRSLKITTTTFLTIFWTT